MFTTTPSIFLIIVIDITTTPNIDILHKTNKYSLVFILPPKYLVDIQTKYNVSSISNYSPSHKGYHHAATPILHQLCNSNHKFFARRKQYALLRNLMLIVIRIKQNSGVVNTKGEVKINALVQINKSQE